MALPKKLKALNLFNDGESYLGQVVKVKLPTLTRKMEEYRGGGMNGPVNIDFGQEKIEVEWKCGGMMRSVLNQYGAISHNAVQLRFAGAYQRDDNGAVDAVEFVVRGRHSDIDPGTGKSGDDTEFSVKTAASYYKLMINGSTVIEIDLMNMIEIVNGVDLLAPHRRAIGA
ncbi:phage major tail tube protein [Xanthomonas fragariae]|uniref:Phage tail tube protein FII n=1 Tax=Xanthomonas fragariae TaxID=48664 RepID=A0A1Y6HDB0_9XANT|nr:phage major tail tube protein [Xanthomonas fragariae]AOD13555.1 phage major tail tube protein [Xanthomonas fragariae]AOD16942.1 phage major tail tube protein [Xanthomonas fragariae]ENZ95229.1 phage-related tail protein [Xanthomonas fragariae LMG 25863]MBL9198123.1 phage major tail tube protein [Xanthomonas fragariae]MBL9222401.1 phage major tail tube protein [Xanthomonas fragariae]